MNSIMAGLVLFLLLVNPSRPVCAAPSDSNTTDTTDITDADTNSTTNYHYGYDNGSRSSLLQLYDGLSIQDIIQSSQPDDSIITPFLSSPLLDNQELKDLTVSLIKASSHLASLQDMESTPVLEALQEVLREVVNDGCRYFHEVLNLPESFLCIPSSLTSLLNRIELLEYIKKAKNMTYNLLPDGADLSVKYPCRFWNTHVLKNCSVSTPEFTLVQENIVEPKLRRGLRTNTCTFCPTRNCE